MILSAGEAAMPAATVVNDCGRRAVARIGSAALLKRCRAVVRSTYARLPEYTGIA